MMVNQSIQSETQKIPKLRFPGFSGRWEEKKLGEAGTFLKGNGISKDDITIGGINQCIRYGELYTKYSEIIREVKSKTNFSQEESLLSMENDVLMPSNGETALDIAKASCVTIKDILLGGGINVLRPNKDANGEFLAYYLSNFKKIDIAKISQGHSVVHLYVSSLKTVEIRIPSFLEQQKISEFIESIDVWMENLRFQKEFIQSYKKGMMQKIFSQEIRFKEDKGKVFPKWEEKKLGSVLDYEQPTDYIVGSTEYEDEYKIPVLTAGKTFILGYTNEIKGIFPADKLPVIIFDDFTTVSQFVDFPFKVKSSAMKILHAKNDADIKFVYEAMQLVKYEIGGHGRHWISKYSNINILMPCIPEQQKIADFLTSVDNLIESKQQRITQAEQWKKGLMQRLFV